MDISLLSFAALVMVIQQNNCNGGDIGMHECNGNVSCLGRELVVEHDRFSSLSGGHGEKTPIIMTTTVVMEVMKTLSWSGMRPLVEVGSWLRGWSQCCADHRGRGSARSLHLTQAQMERLAKSNKT